MVSKIVCDRLEGNKSYMGIKNYYYKVLFPNIFSFLFFFFLSLEKLA